MFSEALVRRVKLLVQSIGKSARQAEDIAGIGQLPQPCGRFGNSFEVSLLVGGRTRLLRHIEGLDVVILEMMLDPESFIDAVENVQLLVLHHRREDGHAMLPGLVFENVNNRVGGVLILVIVIANPWGVGAG